MLKGAVNAPDRLLLKTPSVIKIVHIKFQRLIPGHQKDSLRVDDNRFTDCSESLQALYV
jgi:hypothetical protein